MRMEALLLAFLPQCQTLMHAKTMLFVDNHQRQTNSLLFRKIAAVQSSAHLTAGVGFLLSQPCFLSVYRRPATSVQAVQTSCRKFSVLLGSGRLGAIVPCLRCSVRSTRDTGQRFAEPYIACTGRIVGLRRRLHRARSPLSHYAMPVRPKLEQ